MDINWYEVGWTRAHKSLTFAKGSIQYPTQDKYTKQDERDYCKGYNDCIEFYQENGFNTIEAYGNESDG